MFPLTDLHLSWDDPFSRVAYYCTVYSYHFKYLQRNLLAFFFSVLRRTVSQETFTEHNHFPNQLTSKYTSCVLAHPNTAVFGAEMEPLLDISVNWPLTKITQFNYLFSALICTFCIY